MSLSFAQYGRFLAVGGAVGITCVGIREFIGTVLGDDNPASYSVSVILASMFGILLSFSINRAVTFNTETKAGWSKFPAFAFIACVGIALTWCFSLTIRFGLPLERWLGELAGAVAYGSGSLLATTITYPLNARLLAQRPAHRSITDPDFTPS